MLHDKISHHKRLKYSSASTFLLSLSSQNTQLQCIFLAAMQVRVFRASCMHTLSHLMYLFNTKYYYVLRILALW